jgi:hypothetical protein
MAKKVSIDDVGTEIANIIQEYTEDVSKAIEEENKNISDEAVKELRNTSPKKTGEYAKGWTKKKQGNGYVIYNKNKPSLTHLLEHGHAKRGGGRVSGKPHIRPVEEKAIKKLEDSVIKIIKNGGK